ncbi:AbgT family transporter [Paenibacillus sp. SC116]|uniref:AbgT family transporter n=1 Tax=Paenibacillus sp. SC116 TaxID=2968986 RepID=UPI00215A131B|nr:AbgT family transporter [Paenibacillus sp. SC116]MCR8844250.1 AbgT family transporter [Paenibacillus sp. SC116]
MGSQERHTRKSLLMRSLDSIEKVGNKLPDPVMLFALLSLLVMVVSAILSSIGLSVADPTKPGETLTVMNLLSKEGLQYVFENAVKNFTNFAPLGTVLVTMLGIGVAERSGLITAALRGLVTSVPRQLITASLVFGGVMSSMASDAGYVVLTPLGAVLFAGMGRHPLAGLAAAFAGVSGGFSANLFLTSLDPMLGELTRMAVEPFNPEYAAGLNVAGNYYFMAVSVFLITIIGTFVTDKIVEPRLGTYKGEEIGELQYLTKEEKKGLWGALVSLIVTCGLLSLLVLPSWGPLRGEGDIVSSPFFMHLVPILLIMFLVPGVVYGKMTKSISNSKDVSRMFGDTMSSMGSYIVLAFFAGQFVAYFTQTNLGKILAIKGAELLQGSGITGIPLILIFILICGFINLFIGSASAKWAIMAPVFVPIMMQFGYTPEFTQLVYRIADSTTNIISPLLPYFAVIIAFAQKYDKKIGIGTLISTMIPYSIAFSIGWVIMLFLWMFSGIDIGPGTGVYMK